MQEKLVRFELWEDGDGTLSFFPEGADPLRKFLGAESKLIWWCEARSWEEAQKKKHEHLGWAPYVPY